MLILSKHGALAAAETAKAAGSKALTATAAESSICTETKSRTAIEFFGLCVLFLSASIVFAFLEHADSQVVPVVTAKIAWTQKSAHTIHHWTMGKKTDRHEHVAKAAPGNPALRDRR